MSQYPYPRDEFDVRSETLAPVGAHRVPRSTWDRVRPFLIVVVLAALAAIISVIWLVNRHVNTGTGGPIGDTIVDVFNPDEPASPEEQQVPEEGVAPEHGDEPEVEPDHVEETDA